MLLLAHEAARTLTPVESSQLSRHLDECEACTELVDAQDHVHAKLDLPVVDPGRFDGSKPIAAGGMGKITRAFDRRLGREVAIKEVLAPGFRARFEREAAITARLQHPAIVPIYEAGTWPNGSAFYTMRLVSGGTLADALERRETLAERLELLPHVVAVTEALAYAHSRGIIHRDLKPSNVLVGEFGETVVIDWGLAKELGEAELAGASGELEPALTQDGTIVGTPCFMSPEQARGEPLDERADVFALGAMLYHVLTGVPPYWDRSRVTKDLIDAVLSGKPTPIEQLAPDAPADLRAIVEHAMAREPPARFINAAPLAAELKRFQAGQLLVSREYRLRDLLARWFHRHRTLLAISAAALVLLALVAVIAVHEVSRADALADTAFERGQRKLCAAEAPALASPWTPVARALVHRTFEGQKLPYVAQTLERIDAHFERWAAELAVARDTACAGVGPQLAAELDCLADRTREARALISQFQDADRATVLNAVAATELLAPAARCTHVIPARVVLPDSPARAEIRDLFSQAHALMQLGKDKAAVPIAKRAVAAADANGDPVMRAQALLSLGAAEMTGDLDGATTSLQTAERLADAAQDDRTRAQAAYDLLRLEYWRGHYERVIAMQPAALGAAERIGDRFLASEVLMNVGGALEQLGKIKEAQPLFEQAVAIRRELYGARDHRLAFALSALGNAYAMQGNLDAGIAAHREAVAIGEADLGTAHPNVGVMHGNLASDYTYALRPVEAIAELVKELAVLEPVYGGKHHDIAMALTDLCTAYVVAEDPAKASPACARADAAWRELNANHPARAEALLGSYLAGQGKPEDLATALGLAAGLPPFERARIELALAKISTGAKQIDLLKAAETGFATSTLPLCQRELATVRGMLAAR